MKYLCILLSCLISASVISCSDSKRAVKNQTPEKSSEPDDIQEPILQYTARFEQVFTYNPHASNVMFARGVNTYLGTEGLLTSDCVEGAKTGSFGNLNGATTTIYMDTVKSTEDLYRKVGLDVTLSLAFARASNSASVTGTRNKLTDVKIKSENSYALVVGRKIFPPQNLSEIKMREGLADLYAATPEKFFQNCGNEFISSVTPGAEIIAV